jgi:hypothetical protein
MPSTILSYRDVGHPRPILSDSHSILLSSMPQSITESPNFSFAQSILRLPKSKTINCAMIKISPTMANPIPSEL